MSDAPPAGTFRAAADGGRWTCSGRLTFENAEAALASANALPLPTRGVVDLGSLGHADSAALAVLLALRRRAIAEGGDLAFESVPAAIVSLARVYGVDTLVGV